LIRLRYKITINAPLIMKVRDFIFFMRAKHIIGHFKGFFMEIQKVEISIFSDSKCMKMYKCVKSSMYIKYFIDPFSADLSKTYRLAISTNGYLMELEELLSSLR